MFYEKKVNTDIFNKSAFANKKLIVIKSKNVQHKLQTWRLNTKNNLNFISSNIAFIIT